MQLKSNSEFHDSHCIKIFVTDYQWFVDLSF